MRRNAWLIYLVAGIGACVLYRVGSLARNPYLFEAIGLSAALAIVAGVLIHRPARSLPWSLFAAAQLVFVVGDYCYYSLHLEFPAFADGFYLGFYPIMGAGLFLLIRSRSPGRDWASLLDTSIITIGIGVLAWVFLIEPYAQQPDLDLAERIVSISYPLMDILLMAVAVRLLIGPGRRPKAFWFLGTGILFLVVTDSIYRYIQLNSVYNEGDALDLGWLATCLLCGAAALHPSMRGLFDPAPVTESRLTGSRLVLLATATLIAPIVLIIRSSADLDGTGLPIVEVASACLFLLVLARMTELLVSLRSAIARHRRAEHRETVLREAVARLTTARDKNAIRDAIEEAALDLGTGVGGFKVHVEIHPEAKPAPAPASHAVPERMRGRAANLLLTIPLASQSSVYGLIVATSLEDMPTDVPEALQTLGSQMTLALESATLMEDISRRRTEAKVGALVRNSSDVVMVLDSALNVQYVTPSITRVLGYDETELIGEPFTDLVDPQDACLAEYLHSDLAARPEGCRIEWSMCDSEGRWMDVESVSNDLLENPAVNGIVVTTRDVSERKAMEEGLKSQVRKLQELDGIKNDFVANVSHELRTPLTNIIGQVEMLSDGDFGLLSEKQGQVVNVIDRNSQRLLLLIEDLLTLNHIESGALELRLAETPLADLLEELEREIAPRATGRGVSVVFTTDSDIGSAVVDTEQLERALLNLLTNAVKFSPEGTGVVTVLAERTVNRVVLTVADNGVGIPEEECDRLFTRFFRSSVATNLAIQGSGLGLCIVKRIVEAHLGTIAIDSTLGQGTTVTVTIPTVPASMMSNGHGARPELAQPITA